MVERILRAAFLVLVVKPLCWLVLGVNLRGGERLPRRGPAILAANHNSHLDTLMVLSLFPLGAALRVRPVGAVDYVEGRPLRRLVWLTLMGVLPLNRQPGRKVGEAPGERDPLAGCAAALERGEILLIFPEGTRGEPEQMQAFKNGVAHLAKRFPEAPIVPIFLRGAGKSLPRGEALLVPFICDVAIGEHLRWNNDREGLMRELRARIEALGAGLPGQAWDDGPTASSR
jgi:1-acyl-sn-glycerol-3-phosphate acyltransferase